MDLRIENFLSSLPGVVDSATVRREDRSRLKAAEESNQLTQLVAVKNLGLQVVLERDHAAVILKDSTFRPPPCPTIYLVEKNEGLDLPPGTCLEISGTTYRIVGEEVTGDDKEYAEEQMFLDKGFILFPERLKNRKPLPAFFVLPPLPFPELEIKKNSFGIKDIVSVSPGARSDDYLRATCNFSKTAEYATLLIGWNRDSVNESLQR